MKETTANPGCERSSDLIAFLYHEVDEREALDFRMHLRQCTICSQEAAAFGEVRKSITAWRDEALAGFVSTPVAARATKKSALAAFREFFDLSPSWLKAATAVVLVTLCLLAGRAILSSDNTQRAVNDNNPGALYTQQDVDRLVKDALAKQEQPKPAVETPADEAPAIKAPTLNKVHSSASNQFAKSRRPLSKAEREQLAADLRLLSTGDDEPLYLLGDRINQ